ncbi:CRISPR-associated endoribonuclease Cas2 [Bremerella volcania]|uniref:CRISPR-associated endoribonuclease Cas2 n=2 Tax=Bremerella volcania TaxID=2527984 RepID=A0A518C2Q0_9BACT|nr:CRISPR-associated endoribonuclease Cas2 [Bremerella volcania]
MRITGYRAMWIMAMFDLPTDTKQARKEYALFRKRLLEDGFHRMQYSIYLRPCSSKESTEVHLRRIRAFLPPEGEVAVLSITDKQYERMEFMLGKLRECSPQMPDQLELF